jgi:hypothetical protein
MEQAQLANPAGHESEHSDICPQMHDGQAQVAHSYVGNKIAGSALLNRRDNCIVALPGWKSTLLNRHRHHRSERDAIAPATARQLA